MNSININKLTAIREQRPDKKVPSKRGQPDLFGFLKKDIKLFAKKFGDKKKERFYSELCILFSAGVDIKTSLELIEDQQEKEFERNLISGIKNFVIQGGSFSDALQKSELFSPYEYFSLKIGEESGKLEEILLELAKFFNGKINQKRQILNALSYPAIVIFVAFGAVFFMMQFVIPMFADVFKRFNSDLPAITKLVIKISFLVSTYFWWVFLLFLTGLIILSSQRNENWFRKMSSNLILRLPVIGKTFRKIYLARFCHSMHLLISSRTQLISAIDLVKKMISFFPIESNLEIVKNDLMNGMLLNESMSKFLIYDKRMISLIKVGEEVNQLENIFQKLSENYTSEVEYETKLLGSLIEPILIIFLGIFVGAILVAMYLPLFKLGTSIH